MGADNGRLPYVVGAFRGYPSCRELSSILKTSELPLERDEPFCLVFFGFRSLVPAAQSKVYLPSPGEMVKIEREAFTLERKRKACCLRDGLLVLHGSIF